MSAYGVPKDWTNLKMETPASAAEERYKRVVALKCHCFEKPFMDLYREKCPDITVNRCANSDCNQPASEAAHLKRTGRGNHRVLILPMCCQCNDSTDEDSTFQLNRERYPHCVMLKCCCYNTKNAGCQCVPHLDRRCQCRNAANRRCTCSAQQ